MCCFSRPVDSVSATNIFARSGADGRQFIAYSMTLRAGEDLAMILPLPVKSGSGEKAVEFISLKDYPEFFADLKKGFPEPPPPAPTTRSFGAVSASKLEVVSVGNFEASFVPTVADFARLDERFRLPTGTWEKLPVYKNHGFAVFKLKSGSAKVHPMAFSFPRANPAELFFPTVHIHDGKVHKKAEFDHALYCQRGDTDQFTLLDWDESVRPVGLYMQTSKAGPLLDATEHCYRRRLTGTLPNEDFVLKSEA
ncbi:MAG: hypothetical protein IPK15_02670 [Verrucomicrobia bacterium]|nr:hypothetical protein [Verrucomicrobiota bacterium]